MIFSRTTHFLPWSFQRPVASSRGSSEGRCQHCAANRFRPKSGVLLVTSVKLLTDSLQLRLGANLLCQSVKFRVVLIHSPLVNWIPSTAPATGKLSFVHAHSDFQR